MSIVTGINGWDRSIGVNAKLRGFTPSNSPTSNASAWSSLMTHMTSQGGGTVFIPAGTYQSNAALTVPDNVTIVGEGRRATVLQCAADIPSPNCFLRVEGDHCTVRSLTVDINGQDANGICAFECKYFLFLDCEVRNCPDYGFWIIDFGGQQDLAPTVEAQGTTGATTYGYVVAARDGGGVIRASTEVQISDGNATLDMSNYNQIDWSEIRDAVAYDVYRVTGGGTQGLIGTVAAGTLTLDDTGLSGDSSSEPAETHAAVQYGHGSVIGCVSEARECFENFYVEEVHWDNCLAIGNPDIAGGGTAAVTGYLCRDQSRSIRWSNCQAEGTFIFAAVKITNNDDAVFDEADLSFVNCEFHNDYDAATRYGMYFLDQGNVDIRNTKIRVENACTGMYVGQTSSSRVEANFRAEVDIKSDSGLPLEIASGCDMVFSGRLKTVSGRYLVELGTTTKVTEDILFDRMRFDFSSSHGSAFIGRLIHCLGTVFDRCRFFGDGTNYQGFNNSGSGSQKRVEFHGCHFRSVRINSIHDDQWAIHHCLFSNPENASIGAGGYINANGSNIDYYSIQGNRHVNENGSSTFLFDDTASNKVVADNLQVA